MPSFRTTRRVRHSAAEMFDLVADVERYPSFVPLCKSLTVKQRIRRAGGAEVVLAEMEVGYRAIKERFTSRVTLDRPRLKVLVEYVDGPFSHMENVWAFHDEPAQPQPCSRIEFFISYQFRSRMLGALMGSMFDAAFRRFAAAFEAQADAVYGAPP
ncbi:MAG TPA: type II toxin-antitoxin system RatA family toxin [Roseiarcus sp.]|nr:type II toxin-antitoxin system RatA family toxin [Roseiarcus sp.]